MAQKTKNDTKIQDRIRALLNQARDQQGTPEGEVFERKAYELLAKYGLTEFDLGDTQEDLQQMVSRDYFVEGRYPREKQLLLASIGRSLGCYAVRERGSSRVLLAGTRRNVERTLFLYEMLVLQATSESMKLKGDYYSTTQQVRHSFWVGFASRIEERLATAEHEIHDELRKTSTALVPVNELALAENHFREANANLHITASRSRSKLNSRGHDGGRDAADRADLGQARVQNRKELV